MSITNLHRGVSNGLNNFTKSIDEIMDDVRSKHSDIEINYRKIPVDRQMSSEECKSLTHKMCLLNEKF
jgi:hypothetical protein